MLYICKKEITHVGAKSSQHLCVTNNGVLHLYNYIHKCFIMRIVIDAMLRFQFTWFTKRVKSLIIIVGRGYTLMCRRVKFIKAFLLFVLKNIIIFN